MNVKWVMKNGFEIKYCAHDAVKFQVEFYSTFAYDKSVSKKTIIREKAVTTKGIAKNLKITDN